MTRQSQSRTLYDKIWDSHIVKQGVDGSTLIYIDRHLVHEVTSPQAFEGLRIAGRKVRRPDLTLAVPDHNLPTTARRDPLGKRIPIADPLSATQLEHLERNAAEFEVPYIDDADPRQGIVHVIGPELGFSLPGSTIVCGDSHTASHGGLGALAFGIGTSEVEHVLASQTLVLRKSRNMEVRIDGLLPTGVSAKDLALHVISVIGSAGGVGHVIEYRGSTVESLSIEGRLTLCNMSIEAGARAGIIAPDQTVFDYVKNRPMAPKDKAWGKALEVWRLLKSDSDASFDKTVFIKASDIAPRVSWGTSPDQSAPITACVPRMSGISDPAQRAATKRSLNYMGLFEGQRLDEVEIQNVFIGSCTNSRIEDLRAAANILKGRSKASNVRWAIVVPGSGQVKLQAEREGLADIFMSAGFEWREPGCSACLGMNPDKVPPGERCASTSNRNFVGRQGPGARTHLMSPEMAAAAAVRGRLTDVRQFKNEP